jgi:hypothetical protein
VKVVARLRTPRFRDRQSPWPDAADLVRVPHPLIRRPKRDRSGCGGGKGFAPV